MPVYADFSNRNGEPFMADSPRGREWARNTRSVNDEISSHVARADSVGGLKMTEKMDDSNRPIREFSLAPGATKRDTWMKPYRAEPQLQIRINKNANPPGSAEALAYQARWEETQREIESGQYTLPKI